MNNHPLVIGAGLALLVLITWLFYRLENMH